MKVILASDSHGNYRGLNKLMLQNFDYMFFMGDGIKDLGSNIYLPNVYAVAGNCDFLCDEPKERIINISNKKVLVTHGDLFNVKRGLDSLLQYAKNNQINMVFYGHTHKFECKIIDDIYFVNPGSFKKSSDGDCKYCVVNIDNDMVSVECKTININE